MPPQHHVVNLEAPNCPNLKFTFPHTIKYYESSTAADIGPRIKDATIVVASTTAIPPEALAAAPHVQAVVITATGIDFLDRELFAKRGITVTNTPQSNVDTVAEHFLTLYFSCRRKVVESHNFILDPKKKWQQERMTMGLWQQGPPLGCAQETLGIIGYGHLGKKVEHLAKAVGFKQVLIADRKGAFIVRDGRAPFDQVLRTATTIVVCCPKDASSVNMIAAAEFSVMRPDALLINVARGGIINEANLAAALKERRIFGAGVDVFDTEPAARGTTPLMPEDGQEIPGLTVTGHSAWFSAGTLKNLHEMVQNAVEGVVAGRNLMEDEETRKLVVVNKGEIIR